MILAPHRTAPRAALKGYAARGAEAFDPDAPGPEPDHARRAAVTGKLAELLGQDRTRTARQLGDALGPEVGTGHRQTRRYLSDVAETAPRVVNRVRGRVPAAAN